MASHVRYFSPTDDIQVLGSKPLDMEKAVAMLKSFVDIEAATLNVPNETVYQLKQVLAGLTGDESAAPSDD
ncbi:hypothetical protein BCR44DRAFT_39708, partial [Catenaria anguillulae PL171]